MKCHWILTQFILAMPYRKILSMTKGAATLGDRGGSDLLVAFFLATKDQWAKTHTLRKWGSVTKEKKVALGGNKFWMFGFCNNNWIFLKYSSSRRRFLKQIISHEKKTYSRSQRATSHFSFLYHPFIPMCEILYYLKGLNMQICNTCIRELG